MPRLVVAYMTAWCPDCSRARRVLKRLGVAFKEVDIEEVRGAEAHMRSLNGGCGKVPTICVDDVVLVEPTEEDLTRALTES